jgi:hypothetical protein
MKTAAFIGVFLLFLIIFGCDSKTEVILDAKNVSPAEYLGSAEIIERMFGEHYRQKFNYVYLSREPRLASGEINEFRNLHPKQKLYVGIIPNSNFIDPQLVIFTDEKNIDSSLFKEVKND